MKCRVTGACVPVLPAEAYEPEYEHSIMYVQEYRPSDMLQADNGEAALAGTTLHASNTDTAVPSLACA